MANEMTTEQSEHYGQAYHWALALEEWRSRHDGHREVLERARVAVRQARETTAGLRALRLRLDGQSPEVSEVEELRLRVKELEAKLAEVGR